MAPVPPLRFGTDGIRGVAYEELTAESVFALGRAAARVVGCDLPFVLARDTRESGVMIEQALAAGLAVEGAGVWTVGVFPTPGLAFISQARGLPAAVISASHNPYRDNGIKFFAPGGRKLPDETERKIEAEMAALVPAAREAPAQASDGARELAGAREEYLDHLVGALGGRRLDGLRVVVDCANGAACETAPAVLGRLGADVTVIAAAPDGTNINAGCGSTHPEGLQRAVLDARAQAGLAFDGDADRVIAVHERGDLVDGDHILAMAALDLRHQGRLRHDTVVTTVMANLGFRQAMAARGIRVVETKVGDRYVLEAMEQGGYTLGGEQSGHVIFADLATTGDGLLTGVLLLDLMVRSGRPLSELASVVTKLPQVLENVRVADRAALEGAEEFWAEVRAVEGELGDGGRVLVRPSGTEPVVRVMVEAGTDAQARTAVERLSRRLREALGAPHPGDGA